MTATIVDQGVTLMLYGMGTVFVFLTLLVLFTTGMSQFIMRLLPEAETVAGDATVARAALAKDDIDPRTLAILQSAIDQHRRPR